MLIMLKRYVCPSSGSFFVFLCINVCRLSFQLEASVFFFDMSDLEGIASDVPARLSVSAWFLRCPRQNTLPLPTIKVWKKWKTHLNAF